MGNRQCRLLVIIKNDALLNDSILHPSHVLRSDPVRHSPDLYSFEFHLLVLVAPIFSCGGGKRCYFFLLSACLLIGYEFENQKPEILRSIYKIRIRFGGRMDLMKSDCQRGCVREEGKESVVSEEAAH